MTTTIIDEESLKAQLTQIRTQLNKKQTFEPAIISLKSLLLNSYEPSTQSTKTLFNDVVYRVATVLRTRYTSPGFLTIGADLLETASRLSHDPDHSSKLNSAVNDIKLSLQPDDDATVAPQQRGNGGYLFEGHLTVDSEPAQPNWLVQQRLLTALAASQPTTTTTGEGDGDNAGDNDGMGPMGSLLRGLVESLDVSMMEGLEDLLPGDIAGRRAAPPASKKVVEKLPVVKVDDGVLAKVGEDAECCICKEKLGVGDEMQEMPCKHLFHPLCLKPWLDEHNSCPICRHELPTDDHKYESWKEREKELEEERRGAANAVRGGEFMYI